PCASVIRLAVPPPPSESWSRKLSARRRGTSKRSTSPRQNPAKCWLTRPAAAAKAREVLFAGRRRHLAPNHFVERIRVGDQPGVRSLALVAGARVGDAAERHADCVHRLTRWKPCPIRIASAPATARGVTAAGGGRGRGP